MGGELAAGGGGEGVLPAAGDVGRQLDGLGDSGCRVRACADGRP